MEYGANTVLCERKYVWEKEWISKYESLWSVFNKFMYANNASEKDVFELFGSIELKNPKCRSDLNGKRNLYRFRFWNEEVLKSLLGLNIILLNQDNINKIAGKIPLLSPYNNFLRKHIAFCPECIKVGYHSIFHQVTLINRCPFHNVKLINECPQCKKNIPYFINNLMLNNFFSCSCGYSFYKLKDYISVTQSWHVSNNFEIILPNLIKWININSESINIINSFNFNNQLSMQNAHVMIDYILSTLNREFYKVGNTNSENTGNFIHYFEDAQEQNIINSYIPRAVIAELIKKKVHFFKSDFVYALLIYETYYTIRKHFQNNVFRSIRYCMEKRRKNKSLPNFQRTSCPLYSAYKILLNNLKGYRYYFFMKRGLFGEKWFNEQSQNFFYRYHSTDDVYLDFYNLFFSDYKYKEVLNKENKWAFIKVGMFLLTNHFYNLVNCIIDNYEDFEKNKKLPNFRLGYDSIPLYALKKSGDGLYFEELHWWINRLDH